MAMAMEPAIIMPPNIPAYRREYSPKSEIVTTLPFVRSLCAEHSSFAGSNEILMGCSWKIEGSNLCYVVRTDHNNVRIHENAHCNGWTHR